MTYEPKHIREAYARAEAKLSPPLRGMPLEARKFPELGWQVGVRHDEVGWIGVPALDITTGDGLLGWMELIADWADQHDLFFYVSSDKLKDRIWEAWVGDADSFCGDKNNLFSLEQPTHREAALAAADEVVSQHVQ